MRHVEQRLDVVHDRRLAVQPDLDRERRLVARLAAIALDRLEERRLLAAHIRAGADAQLDLDADVRAVDRVLQPLVRERVLRADVDERALAAGRVRGDRDRLDQPERILLHEDAVLERAGLGLVGVADEVVRRCRLTRDRLPLHPGRERSAAAAEQRGGLDELDHALGPELARALEGLELGRRLRIDPLCDAAQELQPGRLRQRRRRRRDLLLARLRSRDRPQRRRRALAEPETRRRVRAGVELLRRRARRTDRCRRAAHRPAAPRARSARRTSPRRTRPRAGPRVAATRSRARRASPSRRAAGRRAAREGADSAACGRAARPGRRSAPPHRRPRRSRRVPPASARRRAA